MSAIHHYCSHCRTANATESQVCFACQQDTLLNGRYRLLARVGAGRFGRVYRAASRRRRRLKQPMAFIVRAEENCLWRIKR